MLLSKNSACIHKLNAIWFIGFYVQEAKHQLTVDAPSLDAFKATLDVALGSLVWWLATCTKQGG